MPMLKLFFSMHSGANMIYITHYMAKLLDMRLKRALVEFAPEVL